MIKNFIAEAPLPPLPPPPGLEPDKSIGFLRRRRLQALSCVEVFLGEGPGRSPLVFVGCLRGVNGPAGGGAN